jgi:hypothetical protein
MFPSSFGSMLKEPAKRPNLEGLLEHAWVQRVIEAPADMVAWARNSIPPAEL